MRLVKVGKPADGDNFNHTWARGETAGFIQLLDHKRQNEGKVMAPFLITAATTTLLGT